MSRLRMIQFRTRVWYSLAGAVALILFTGLVYGVEQGETDFEIMFPEEGATVSSPVALEVSVSGADIGRPSAGLNHIHVAVDDGKARSIYETGPISLDLEPGEHTVMVEIAGPNHRALLPPKHVTFTVE